MNETMVLRGGPVEIGDPVDGAYPVKRFVLLSGREMYSEAKEYGGRFVIDLATIRIHKERLTLDYTHNEDEVVGFFENFRFVPTIGLEADAWLVPFGDDRAAEVIHKSRAKVPYEASPTVLPNQADVEDVPEGVSVTVNGEMFAGPIRVFRNMPLRGGAVCPYGTDKYTEFSVLNLNLNTHEKENIMADAPNTVPDPEGAKKVEGNVSLADLKTFVDEFGAEAAVAYVLEGLTFDDAVKREYQNLKQAKLSGLSEDASPTGDKPKEAPKPPDDPEKSKLHSDVKGLRDEISGLKAEVKGLRAAFPRGEKEPVSQSSEPKEKESKAPAKNLSAVQGLAAHYRDSGVKQVNT